MADDQTSQTRVQSPSVELSWRGLALGAAVTVVFLASNLYLGLRSGLTFSTSIPAALIAMGCLRAVGGGGVLENNIVQTQASAAGTLCNVSMALPGLVLIDWWQGFPFWETTAVCALGGLLGVAFSAPLRRALVAGADLPYPEGSAAAQLLQTGDAQADPARARRSLRNLMFAACASGSVAIASNALRLLSDAVSFTLTAGGAVFRLQMGFSLALAGAGYLIGISACLAILVGVVLAWGIGVPILTALGAGAGHPPADAAQLVWSGPIRLVGAGIMATAGLFTIGRLAPALVRSLREVARAKPDVGARPGPEGDMPARVIGLTVLLCAAAMAALILHFTGWRGLGAFTIPIDLAAVLFTIGAGFVLAAACGYLAGLVGSSTSPISGMAILAVLAASIPMALVPSLVQDPHSRQSATGLVLLLGAVIVTACAIANDNLQDLKTGQLLGATPWRQQAALAAGVAIGAPVIAPLLNVLYQSYGFATALPHAGMDKAASLPAPQASLLAAIAREIADGRFDWGALGVGAIVGGVLVAAEGRLRRKAISFPALSVGIGVYLPPDAVMAVVAGGVLAWIAARLSARHVDADREASRQQGVIAASGFLIGESIAGVAIAAIDTLAGHAAPLALSIDHGTATVAAVAVFLAAGAGLVWSGSILTK